VIWLPKGTRIDAYVIRWARRKYQRMVHQTRARDWFDRLRRATPKLFAHWAAAGAAYACCACSGAAALFGRAQPMPGP
jgi:hypothetical protein